MILYYIMNDSLLNDLNKEQKEAVKHTHGPSLILAGAGSGKTRVLTYKTAYMILSGRIPADSILMVTFTNKAAGEMKKRISGLIKSSVLPYASTFHSLCVKILKVSGQAIGISPQFVIYDDNDQKDAVKEVMKKLDISQKSYSPQSILHAISQAKNELLGPGDYTDIAYGRYQEIVALVYHQYQKLLEANQALDFDDLILKTVFLLKQSEAIRTKYQHKFPFIMVDEYQDTNKAQYELTKLLTGPDRNLTVVGDASQSIYKWRGADYKNITFFQNDFPDVSVFKLDRNYRSTQIVLDAAYSVISKNVSHPILSLWTDKKAGQKITLYEARNERDEATFITQNILQSDIPHDEIAVLYRTNAQSRVIEEAFLHAGIPYNLVGGIRFYERREIKDILSYISIVYNPKDTIAMKRAQKIGRKRYDKFADWLDKNNQDNKLISLTTTEILTQILGVTDYLSLYDVNIEEDAYRLENIQELKSVAVEYPVLSDFLENVALTQREYSSEHIRALDQKRKCVNLMTLHAAKGLEFQDVFMTGMEEGLFPHSRSLMEKEEMEEERRLCYVGITRAKEKLYLTFANKRLFFGTRTQNTVSRFVSDIPAELLEYNASLNPDRPFQYDDFLF